MKNSNIEWTHHTVNFWWGCSKVSPACTHCYAETVAKVFGKRLFGTVPQWGKGQPRFERLRAARKEALALNNEAAKCRLIDGEVFIYTGSGQTIGRPETFRITVCRQDIPLKKREFKDRREVTQEEWDNAPRWRPRVFVNSMSDWLDAEVPIEWLAYLLETLFLCPHLDFQLLTKRPENFPVAMHAARMHLFAENTHPNTAFLNWFCGWWPNPDAMETGWSFNPPTNIWIGTTVENQQCVSTRIPHLLRIPAKVRFLSCEPLLEDIDVKFALHRNPSTVVCPHCLYFTNRKEATCPNDGAVLTADIAIDWVIAGGESGGQARPSHPDWFRSLRDQCTAAGVPFFFKQWGEYLPTGEHAAHLPADRRFKAQAMDEDGLVMIRAGKDLTGRRLDGQEWSQFPSVP